MHQQQLRQLKQLKGKISNANSWIGNAKLEIAQREKKKKRRKIPREVTYPMTQTISPLTTHYVSSFFNLIFQAI